MINYSVDTIDPFENEAKRLKKKFISLKKELDRLIDQLEQNPFLGESLGKGFYKIRIAIQSKGKGKSGGGRVITFVKIIESKVYLVSIYDKSEQSDMSIEKLNSLFDAYFKEY